MINVLTEEEAKEKRCPGHMPNADCWPRTCMAWRFVDDSKLVEPEGDKGFDLEQLGYCGLGGKP